MRPSPLRSNAGHAYLASRNGLVSRMASSASQRSSGNSATGRDVLEAGVGDDGVEAPEALERRIDGAAVALAGGEVRGERLAGRVAGGLEVDRPGR